MTKRAFDRIKASLEEAIEFAQGNNTGARVHHVAPIDVAKVRKKTGLSQAEFSATYAIPIGTLRGWEQGLRHPTGPAAVLLHVIDKQPAAVTKVAKKIRVPVAAE